MIKVIIGLGNPGPQFSTTRHNVGFMVLDALAERHHASWKSDKLFDYTTIVSNGNPIMLLKPQTFMNESGNVIPVLRKKGITPDQLLVVHDELELPFGKLAYKESGSARGHNGLRSLIAAVGDTFGRIRVGIGRPEKREEVPTYVLARFTEPHEHLQLLIEQAIALIEQKVAASP